MDMANNDCSIGPGMKSASVNGFVPLTALNMNSSSKVSVQANGYPLYGYAVQVRKISRILMRIHSQQCYWQ